MSENVAEVRNLIARFGTRTILDKVSLDIKHGEILVIMGGSGSGKSTFLNHLLGLLTPSGGSVSLLGTDMGKANFQEALAVRCRTGVAFQGGALFSSLTVGENVRFPLQEHTRLDATTMAIMARLKLEVVSMSHAEYLMPAELSGGMIKRAALARAIVMDPDVLFCDEPSAGLDPVTSAEIDSLLMRLRDFLGMSIVVVTHELESAFKIADRICVLGGGHIIALGTPEEIRQSTNESVQNLLNRRMDKVVMDSDSYLRRLTGKTNEKA